MKLLLRSFFVLCSVAIFAQNEASNWYFGKNAGLHFDNANGTVAALTDGLLNTLEGCTSMSDDQGNLLFYSDGRTVWNRLHQPMGNADESLGNGLLGHDSSTSSGLIVPKPQSPGFYYIFTVDEPHHFNSSAFPNQSSDDGSNDGFNYSLIDMSLNNGLGDVVTAEKNVHLITYDLNDPDEVDYKCSEKISAVKADDCTSFWVITHFTNTFYTFKVGINGVESTPITSVVGPVVPTTGYRRNALGYLKASPDGSMLAVAHLGFATTLGGNAPGGVYLLDFDNATGLVSSSKELYSPNLGNSPYGIEFSADNKKLYATIEAGDDGRGPSSIVQWDLESENISNSIQILHTSNSLSGGALQLGIDKKIYRAQLVLSNPNGSGRYLGVINNPEATGTAANYEVNGILIDVNGNYQNISRIGLPPFIQSLFNSKIDIIQNGISDTQLKLCLGDSYTLSAVVLPEADYSWTKDGELLSETSSELFVEAPGHYEVFIEPNTDECPIEGSAIVKFYDIPVAITPENLKQCSDAVLSNFDLSSQTASILNGQAPLTHQVLFYTSENDATEGTNPIGNDFSNTSNPQTIYARVQAFENPNCYDITSFEIENFISPQINTLEDIILCDSSTNSSASSGYATFNLSDFNTDILGHQNPDLYIISYYTSEVNALNKTNELPDNYTNTNPYFEMIFVRIEHIDNQDCFKIDNFTITINETPALNNVTLIQCDGEGSHNGLTVFNLNQIESQITPNTINHSISYYRSLEQASTNTNPIHPEAFQNTTNPQIVFAKVTDELNGCSSIAEVRLEVATTTRRHLTLAECDDDGNDDGFYNFDLSQARAELLTGLDIHLDIKFYETYEQALLEQQPLQENFINSMPYAQTIYARLENENACYGISKLYLKVYSLPQLEPEHNYFYCLNETPEPLYISAGVLNDSPSNYYYLWNTGATTSEIAVDEPGTYQVRVTTVKGCFKDQTIRVYASNIATITDFKILENSQHNSLSIFVTGEGDYEYALDDIFGPYQESSIFNNVLPGQHIVYVRDRHGCGIVERLISVIGFPKFFTPNDDGYNDYWQVQGITQDSHPKALIYIFDRQGKLLRQLDPLGPGWDGKLNGYKLPGTDYWYAVTLEDGRLYRGHFTLRR